jgi:hypothetical protein
MQALALKYCDARSSRRQTEIHSNSEKNILPMEDTMNYCRNKCTHV